MCFGVDKKQDDCPGLWLAETVWIFSLKPQNGIQWNLTRSNISTSSNNIVYFGPIGKTKWPPWPLIGWEIFDFSSETTEWDLPKQELNALYQFCVFWADRKKQKYHHGLWLAVAFLISSLKLLNGIYRNFIGGNHLTSSIKFVFFMRIGKQDGCPGLWLTETFSIYSLKLLNRIQRNMIESKNSTSFTKFIIFFSADYYQHVFHSKRGYSAVRSWPFGPLATYLEWSWTNRKAESSQDGQLVT